ncbi:F-box/FBD/LRR-repeat protein At3g52680 [Linum perenne]
MEPAYLRSGGRSREADRISELPDEIIHDILERLKYSQTTLALSRRWMQIWLSYPIIEFHCNEDFNYSAKLQSFVAAAARKLSSSQHSRIKALRISSECSAFIRDVLDLIANREPEEIFVKYNWNQSYQLFPTQLINNPRLRIIDLCCCKFWEFPDTNHLDMRMINLRVLRLDDFIIDERVLNLLIAASPLLEELKLSDPKKRISRLDICNNPNLKILQLEDCTIWELIQIAGTTKSLETMSLRCIDLDISPSQLTSLKSLKINSSSKLTGEFISNMIANLPSLQSLYLYHNWKVKELEIRSDSLLQLKLDNLFPEMRLRIHIDAPRLVDVQYHGSMRWLPTITRSANLREAQLCTFAFYLYFGSTYLNKIDDFIKLKDFLAELRQQFRFDQLCLNFKESPLWFHGDVVDWNHDDSPIPMIDNLEFEFNLSRMDGKGGFINALFRSCYPKYLLMHSKKSYQYMAESFINRRNNDSCCKSECKCWRHQLKDVKIVSRREDEGGEQLSDISNYLNWPCTEEEKRVWLKLIWDSTCSAFS